MSEEEILEILKEFNKIKTNSYAMQFVNIPYPKLQMAIQCLLDLYEKEKEKNKTIEKIFKENEELYRIHKDEIAEIDAYIIKKQLYLKEIEVIHKIYKRFSQEGGITNE